MTSRAGKMLTAEKIKECLKDIDAYGTSKSDGICWSIDQWRDFAFTVTAAMKVVEAAKEYADFRKREGGMKSHVGQLFLESLKPFQGGD